MAMICYTPNAEEVVVGALENIKYINRQMMAITKMKADTLNKVWNTSRILSSGSNGSMGARVSVSFVSLRGGLIVGGLNSVTFTEKRDTE